MIYGIQSDSVMPAEDFLRQLADQNNLQLPGAVPWQVSGYWFTATANCLVQSS